MKQLKVILATAVASLLVVSVQGRAAARGDGAYADSTARTTVSSGKPCSQILRASLKLRQSLPELGLIQEALKNHVSVRAITPAITQRAIINFMNLVDPLHVTLTAQERETLAHMPETDLEAVQTNLFSEGDREIFLGIAKTAVNRLYLLNKKFLSEKPFRDRVLQQINNQPNAMNTSPPKDEAQIESRYLDLFAWWAKFYFYRGYTQPEAFVMAIRTVRRGIVSFMQTLNAEGMSLLIAKAYIGAFDPHSMLESPIEATMHQIRMSGQISGIGIKSFEHFNGLKIFKILSGSPAEKAGLKSGDVITHVADPLLASKKKGSWYLLRSAQEPMDLYLNGPAGSTVTVRVQRGAQSFEKTVTREAISLAESKIKIDLSSTPQGEIARVRFDGFYHGMGDQLRQALEETLQHHKISAVILDLRDNPGGLIDEMIKVLGIFIKSGPALQLAHRDSNGHLRVEVLRISPENNPVWLGPLVVLTDSYSASASEALAGALQDYQRAIVIGSESTYGKGSAQNGIDLRGNGMLKLTTNLFFTPAGRTPQIVGISPDIVLPNDEVNADGARPRERNFSGVIEPFDLSPASGFDDALKETLIPSINSVILTLKQKAKNQLAQHPIYTSYKQNTREAVQIAADLVQLLHENH